MNDITYRNIHSVKHPVEIFTLDIMFNELGFNIHYKGKYIDDTDYYSVQWNSIYKNDVFGNFYKDSGNKHHVFPIKNINNKNNPIEFTFITKYCNEYVKDLNS